MDEPEAGRMTVMAEVEERGLRKDKKEKGIHGYCKDDKNSRTHKEAQQEDDLVAFGQEWVGCGVSPLVFQW